MNQSINILRADAAESLLQRRTNRMAEAEELVKPILGDVRARGDAAVLEYARRFDNFTGSSFKVAQEELAKAESNISEEFRKAVTQAATNIEKFARLQMPLNFKEDLAPGHMVGQVIRPLDCIAAYIPGGRYPLPSTVLMTCVPALVAGVQNIWITTPKANQETYATASVCCIKNVAQIGGAHAIAA